ncbi:hypothetical protein B296_00037348 [Ensete ventricosum]|uniref:20S proteasome alpha subunit C n=2 Tax=Ensete ventricosum TaxID=4639 RepID=A0A426XA84_ENSVE|nr:hypothetical protein B296_00037348 [Ensete ventricosum]
MGCLGRRPSPNGSPPTYARVQRILSAVRCDFNGNHLCSGSPIPLRFRVSARATPFSLRPTCISYYQTGPDHTTGREPHSLPRPPAFSRMSRRYDSRTTIFSPEGRLYQVEYAMEAIGNAGAAIGILARDGVVLVGEKKVTSKLLQTSRSTEKMYKIDDHLACAVAGIMSDANILINTARVQAQRYTFAYQEPMPVEQLVQSLCDTKQGYTQFGGLRPFGVSFLFAGWDKNFGFQLYMSDPSGNYSGWKAAAIGANNQAAQSMLKQDYKDEITREEGVQLSLKVLSKTMDSTSLTSEKLELAEIFLEPTGEVKYQVCKPELLEKLLVKYGVTQAAAEST